MFRVLRRFYQVFRGKTTASPPVDFDTLFAMLEAEQRHYRLEQGIVEDDSEDAVQARRHELERYFERYKPTREDILDALHSAKPGATQQQLT